MNQLFPKNNIRQSIFNFSFLLFLLALLFRFFKQLSSTYGFQTWQISEFLINYQGGFVRRGLLGEMLFLFASKTHLDLEWMVKFICLISFLAVCVFFIKAFLKRDYALYILPLCFFLGMGILSDNWIRKDYLMLYFFILILKSYQRNWPLAIKILMINSLFAFVLLTHEVFAFFSLPAILLLFFGQYRPKGNLLALTYAIISLLPSIFCLFVTLHYHGNATIAQAIWDSWQPIAGHNLPKVLDINAANAVSSLGWQSGTTFKEHFTMNFLAIDNDIFSLFIWLVTFPIVYYIATNFLMVFRKTELSFTENDQVILSSIIIFQLVSLLPVFFILSCDFIRIFFYCIGSAFAIFLIIPTETLNSLIPTVIRRFIIRLNASLATILTPNKTILVFLMLFIGISTYTFFLKDLVRNSMIYQILCILSKPFVILNKLWPYAFKKYLT
ncbi:MAG: hypothetical protein REI78_12950 [Pedobacter sp.]|nr:hypothetical protein [Pedobacter sp.]MDQ8053934.1 hypothetical protein [Pedobacter sp.]